jgi:anti-anti-sigma regulatory factor
LVIRADRAAQQRGTTVTIVSRAGPIARLLQMCGLERKLRIIEDSEAEPGPGSATV